MVNSNLLPTLPIGPASSVAVSGIAEAAEQKRLLRETFNDFLGQTFYGQLMASMRKTVDKPAYFHGGRAEEVFQGQMDQLFAERMSDATADRFSGPMFDLFSLTRQ